MKGDYVSIRKNKQTGWLGGAEVSRANKGNLNQLSQVAIARLTAAEKLRVLSAYQLHQGAIANFGAGNIAPALRDLNKVALEFESIFGEGHFLYASVLVDVGACETEIGDSQRAKKLLTHAQAVLEDTLIGPTSETALVLEKLGNVHVATGDIPKAIELLKQATEQQAQLKGTRSLEYAIPLANLGNAYAKTGRFLDAERCGKLASEIFRQRNGPRDRFYLKTLANLASNQAMQGRINDARKSLEMIIATMKGLPTADVDLPSVQLQLADVETRVGNYAKAITLIKDMVVRIQRSAGKNQAWIVGRIILAEVYRLSGELPTAERLAKENQKLLDEIDSVAIRASTLFLAAHHAKASGNYDRAEELYQKSLELSESKGIATFLGTANVLVALVETNIASGKFSAAEVNCRKLDKIVSHLDEANLVKARVRILRAAVYATQRRFEEAEAACRSALKHVKRYAPDDLDTRVACHRTLAAVYYVQNKPRESRHELELAWGHIQKLGGENHNVFADLASGLASAYASEANWPKATEWIDRTQRSVRKRSGEQHPTYALSLQLAGEMQRRAKNFPAARSMLDKAKAVQVATIGTRHPDYARTLQFIGLVEADLYRGKEAAEALSAANQVYRRHIADVLPGMAEEDQLRFLAAQADQLRIGLRVVLLPWYQKSFANMSAEWWLNSKGLVHETLADVVQRTRDSRSDEVKRLDKELRSYQKQLAQLMVAMASSANAAVLKQKVAELAAKEKEGRRRLGQMLGREVREEPWISLEEIRSKIPSKAALVMLARIQNRANNSDKFRLGAFIIPQREPVTFHDLGDSQKIDFAVSNVRDMLGSVGKDLKAKGVRQSEIEFKSKLKELSELILKPMEKRLSEFELWAISPDDSLWLFPWESLLLSNGKYAVEEHAISYLLTGRELIRDKVTSPKNEDAVIVADPDFDLAYVAERTKNRAETRSVSLPQRFPNLPGTAREADAIRPVLQNMMGKAPLEYRGSKATESVVKAVKNPSYLVLSTHGYFLPREALPLVELPQLGKPMATASVSNPLVRCGLVLAGANRRAALRDRGAGSNDGILTGLEIVGLDLRGTQLSVLSACETGIGDIRNGEGLAGLRHAFHLAGSESVLASLWSVPDLETSELMEDFWLNLAAGNTKRDALRKAQLSMIERQRESMGATHPYFWGAFTLSGSSIE